jgi:hypothetical protein
MDPTVERVVRQDSQTPTGQVDPDRDVRGLVAHVVAVADLHHRRVQVDDREGLLQRPACQVLISSAISSVIFEMVSWDSSVPSVRARRCWMSRTVIPPAYSEMIIS